MQQFSIPPSSRDYVHNKCGNATEVNGEEFLSICDPRYAVSATFCSQCGTHDDLRNFCWADTGESLDEYRVRLNLLVPLWARIAGANWLFAVWIALAAISGYALSLVVPNFKIAFGIPALLFFVIGASADAAGKFLTPEIVFRSYQ